MEESAGLTAVDLKKQRRVDRENDRAIEDFEDAANFVATDRLDKGIREFAKAWHHAVKAEEHALKAPKS